MFILALIAAAAIAAGVGAIAGHLVSEIARTKGDRTFLANKSGLTCVFAVIVGLFAGAFLGGFGCAVLAALVGAALSNTFRKRIFFD